jgi:hypothetical protein
MSSRSGASSRTWLAIAVLLILVLSPCLGLGGGVAYLAAHRNGSLSRWHSLGQPPAPVSGFVTGDVNVIYAATNDGRVFSCESESRTRDACWVLAEPPYTVDDRADFEHSVISGDPPPPPAEPVESLYVSRFYAEMAIEARYVLLGDGTVWVWLHQASGYTALLVLLAAPVLGLGLGLVLIVVLVILNLVRRRRPA